jgi:hypothetical protein
MPLKREDHAADVAGELESDQLPQKLKRYNPKRIKSIDLADNRSDFELNYKSPARIYQILSEFSQTI